MLLELSDEEKIIMVLEIVAHNNAMMTNILSNQSMMQADLDDLKKLLFKDQHPELIKLINDTYAKRVKDYNSSNESIFPENLKAIEKYILDVTGVLRRNKKV